MTSIAFYNSQIFPDNRPFDAPEYAETYTLFAKILSEKGGTMYVVRGLKHYDGENAFNAGWKYADGEWVWTEEPFTVDLIFNRGFDFPLDQALRIVNSPEMTKRCLKSETARLFPEDCPVTRHVEDAASFEQALTQIKTDMVVFKPLDNYGGEGVVIVSKAEAANHLPEYPFLLQEFIDTSKGIPGLCESRHDLRISFVGDSLTDCYLRTPAEGKLLSNVAQGGSIRQVLLEDIPQGARALAFKVDKAMSDQSSRIYCVDIGLHDGKEWKIIELNAPPGMPIVKEDAQLQRHLEYLADHLLTFARA